MTDPLTGSSGSLLRGDGFDPLLIETNTSTEYWQKGASLLHTDPPGGRDLALPANARVYHDRRHAARRPRRARTTARRLRERTNPHAVTGVARASGRARRVGDRRPRAAREPCADGGREHSG